MVRSVETIRKELKSLEAATATLAEEFDRLYGTYLDALGQAIRQQVVLATYHLCTPGLSRCIFRSFGQSARSPTKSTFAS